MKLTYLDTPPVIGFQSFGFRLGVGWGSIIRHSTPECKQLFKKYFRNIIKQSNNFHLLMKLTNNSISSLIDYPTKTPLPLDSTIHSWGYGIKGWGSNKVPYNGERG